MYTILTINPGSTSTKAALFKGGAVVFSENIPTGKECASSYSRVLDQLDLRCELLADLLADRCVAPDSFDAVVGRGGILSPIPSGTYLVNDEMKDYLRRAPRGEHASNLGALMADRFALPSSCPAFIVDPVSVDELTEVAKISGAPEIRRSSLVHALNQKAVARKVAADLEKKIEDCRFVVVHLGSGITIGAHIEGRIVDVIGAKADGPFSPERAGGLPVGELVDFIFSGGYTKEEIDKKLLSGWGLVAYLGTRDIREAFDMAEHDHQARTVLEAMVYQIAKGIGEMSVVLNGYIDAIILTGGMAYSKELVGMIGERVKFLAPLKIVPGENEMGALFEGAERVLRGDELPRHYPTGRHIKLRL